MTNSNIVMPIALMQRTLLVFAALWMCALTLWVSVKVLVSGNFIGMCAIMVMSAMSILIVLLTAFDVIT